MPGTQAAYHPVSVLHFCLATVAWISRLKFLWRLVKITELSRRLNATLGLLAKRLGTAWAPRGEPLRGGRQKWPPTPQGFPRFIRSRPRSNEYKSQTSNHLEEPA